MFLSAAHRLPVGSPYDEALYRYSPAFAWMLMMVPSGAVTIAAWRVASVVVLGLAMRGATTPMMLALTVPAALFDVASGNVTCFALALMIAVLRWPGPRSAIAYAVFVILVPKPEFLPVLLWAFLHVPTARRGMVLVGLGGATMLLYPGYAGALFASGGEIGALFGFDWHLPLACTIALVGTGAILTVAAQRWPRLLGAASVLLSGYWYPYVFAPLGLPAMRRQPAA